MKERTQQLDPKRWLSDEVWTVLEPLLQKVRNRQGPKERQSDRAFLTAIAYLLKEGCSWRALPPQFGHWHNVYMRFRRWEKSRSWTRLWLALQDPGKASLRVLFIDSTVVKAHPDAAGAPQKTVARRLWDALMAD